MKKLIYTVLTLAVLTTSFMACREQSEKEEVMQEMKDEGAEVKVKDDKIKMETEDKKVKITDDEIKTKEKS
ncbi:MAG: Ni/Co efflux regulator RcnB [Olleya marilimosa]|jgi:Ni/Co efflux regulator RcnB|uniref:Lipoprotein n=1 Tax=Olleya marilimosa TaxID=272164 RepID=A0ABR8LSX9_9FLAO|nr:hypothetical protein [Olleya marilimosa]MBD3863297.1 hypothetical protein [Olleya marilimosa]MBD3890774.1 hypothetical protein [Olleya marilimosa]|tara:strand:+ start:84601 stop:84813 length:213 start_codon:yes stop_codon:yes gene_type:complete